MESKAWRQYQQNKANKERRIGRKFYEDKLSKNPDMPRYNQALAAIAAEAGEIDYATGLYRKAMANDPNNIMLRSDMALHYSKIGRKQDAVDELKRGLVFNPKHNVLHKNLAGVYSRTGRYEEALNHAQEALWINPDDPMNHRNIAAVHEMMGDTRRAYEHQIQSINIENNNTSMKKSTSAYRNAAKLTVTRGGKIEDGIALMAAARRIEGKHYESDTTSRTNEILAKIAKRKGNQLAEMAKIEAALEEKKAMEESIKNGNVGHLLPEGHAIIRGPERPLPLNRQKSPTSKKKKSEKEKDKEDTGEEKKSKSRKKHKNKDSEEK